MNTKTYITPRHAAASTSKLQHDIDTIVNDLLSYLPENNREEDSPIEIDVDLVLQAREPMQKKRIAKDKTSTQTMQKKIQHSSHSLPHTSILVQNHHLYSNEAHIFNRKYFPFGKNKHTTQMFFRVV